MKILILTNHFNIGGITVYILNLCRSLHGKNGIEVMVASRGGDAQDRLKAIGVKHIQIPLTTKCEFSPKVFVSFFKLKKAIKDEGVDIIHANTRVTQVLANFLSTVTKKPYVSTCHGYFKLRFSRRVFPCWGRRVIAISDQVRQHLMRDFKVPSEDIKVIYNGIDLKKFHSFTAQEIIAEKKRLGLDISKRTIGHIGRLSSVKGQKYFILAAAEVLKKERHLQFVIIGEGKEKLELDELILKLGLQNAFFIQPSVEDTALSLSVMDVFVMPSLEEGLGLSILEAQAQGVPVVASNVGGIPTIIQDRQTGLLVPSKDPVLLGCAIIEMLQNASLRDLVITKAKQDVAVKFSVDLMAQKTQKLYEGICSN